jgi:LPS export ABC transporter protein LptC
MIWRVLFALVSLTALGALLYLHDSDDGSALFVVGEPLNAEPGYVAIHGHLIETGDNGHPLYRLYADRIVQPTPQGTVYLTQPSIDYQLDPADHWTITALQGELPQDASTAELNGDVHAEGRPPGSDDLMRIDTDVLHLDMPRQLVTTAAKVRVNWKGSTLRGRGMRAELKDNRLQLFADVRGTTSVAH